MGRARSNADARPMDWPGFRPYSEPTIAFGPEIQTTDVPSRSRPRARISRSADGRWVQAIPDRVFRRRDSPDLDAERGDDRQGRSDERDLRGDRHSPEWQTARSAVGRHLETDAEALRELQEHAALVHRKRSR